MRHASCLALIGVLLLACGPPVPRDDYDNDPHARSGRRQSAFARDKREIDKYTRMAQGQVTEGNILVSYTYLDVQELQRMGFSLGGDYFDGTVGVVAGRDGFRRNGLSVGLAGKHFGVRLSGGQRSVRSSQRMEQFVSVIDGGTASIQIGQVTPVSRLLYYGPDGAAYTVDLVGTGAAMVVSPKIIDRARGLVRVRISPDISILKADGGVELTRIHTDVIVRRGQAIVIGALPTSRATVARSMFSYRAGSHTRQRVILLRVKF